VKKHAHLFFLFLTLLCLKGTAQIAAPLSKLHMQAGSLTPIHLSAPYNKYKPAPLIPRIQAGGNIGNGELYLAAASGYYDYDAGPSFTSLVLTLGYAHNISVHKKIWLKPGVAFGNHNMDFHRLTGSFSRNESELLLEASFHIQTALYKKLHILAGSSFQRTMLYHRFDVWNADMALVYYINTPGFVKKLID
jgi:hypothetical protein